MQNNKVTRLPKKSTDSDITLRTLDQKLNTLDVTVNKLDQRMNKLEIKVDKIDKRMDHLESKFDQVNLRLTNVEKNLYALNTSFQEMNERTALIPRLYDKLDKLVGGVLEDREERVFMTHKLTNHESRIGKLEKRK